MIYDFENLFNAYKAGIKCKRYRPDVMAYTDKLEENLIELQNEFIWQTYTVVTEIMSGKCPGRRCRRTFRRSWNT